MDFWKILDIEPTDNVSVIKKAYAKKLKIYHPEDDPEGYQKLREAFDSAIRFAKKKSPRHEKANNSFYDLNMNLSELITDKNLNNINAFNNTNDLNNANLSDNNEKLSYKDLTDNFIKEAKALYDNFKLRICTENWVSLLNSDAVWYAGNKEYLNNRVIEFLMSNHYLPHEVWKLLEGVFHWNDKEDYLYDNYPWDFVRYLLYNINYNNMLRYCFFSDFKSLLHETYLKLREDAFNALNYNDFEQAEEFINKALEIYKKDPDLLIMKGRCYIHKGDYERAIALFKMLLCIDKENQYAHYYRAKLKFRNKQYIEALEDLLCIREYMSQNYDYLYFLAKCYYNTSNLKDARETMLEALKLNSKNVEGKKLLQEIDLKLIYIFNKKLTKNKRDAELKKLSRQLYEELGIRYFHIKKCILLEIALIALLLIITVFIFTSAGLKITFYKDSMKISDSKLTLINNTNDLDKAPLSSFVQGEIKNAAFIEVYKIQQNDKIVYLSDDEVTAKKLTNCIKGYVCIGTLNNKNIILEVDYDDSETIYDKRTLNFQGKVEGMNADMLNAIKKQYKDDNFDNEILTDRYIDTQNNSDKAVIYSGAFYILIFAVLIFTLQSLFLIVKLIKYKWKVNKSMHSSYKCS